VRWLKYIITQTRLRLYLEFMLRRVDLCNRCNEPATRRQSVWLAMRESKQVNANLPEDTERPEETRLRHGLEKFSDNKRLRGIIGFETARKHSRKRRRAALISYLIAKILSDNKQKKMKDWIHDGRREKFQSPVKSHSMVWPNIKKSDINKAENWKSLKIEKPRNRKDVGVGIKRNLNARISFQINISQKS